MKEGFLNNSSFWVLISSGGTAFFSIPPSHGLDYIHVYCCHSPICFQTKKDQVKLCRIVRTHRVPHEHIFRPLPLGHTSTPDQSVAVHPLQLQQTSRKQLQHQPIILTRLARMSTPDQWLIVHPLLELPPRFLPFCSRIDRVTLA